SMEGGQPGVSRRDAVFADTLQMFQEGANRVGAQVCQRQGGADFLMLAAHELQKELQSIPVSQHGMAAEAALSKQVLLEEPANGYSDVSLGHELSFRAALALRSEHETARPHFPTALPWREDKLRCRSAWSVPDKWITPAAWRPGSLLRDTKPAPLRRRGGGQGNQASFFELGLADKQHAPFEVTVSQRQSKSFTDPQAGR